MGKGMDEDQAELAEEVCMEGSKCTTINNGFNLANNDAHILVSQPTAPSIPRLLTKSPTDPVL